MLKLKQLLFILGCVSGLTLMAMSPPESKRARKSSSDSDFFTPTTSPVQTQGKIPSLRILALRKMLEDKDKLLNDLERLPRDLYLHIIFELIDRGNKNKEGIAYINKTVEILKKMNQYTGSNYDKQVFEFFLGFLGQQLGNLMLHGYVEGSEKLRGIYKFPSFYQALHKAIRDKNHLAVHFLLSKGVNPNKSPGKKSSLFYAAEIGNEKIVKTLIKFDAIINENKELIHQPIWAAVRSGNIDSINALVNPEGKEGYDLNRVYFRPGFSIGNVVFVAPTSETILDKVKEEMEQKELDPERSSMSVRRNLFAGFGTKKSKKMETNWRYMFQSLRSLGAKTAQEVKQEQERKKKVTKTTTRKRKKGKQREAG